MTSRHYQSTVPKPDLRQNALWKLEEEVQEVAYFLRNLPDTPGLQPRGRQYADLLQAGFAKLGVNGAPIQQKPSNQPDKKAAPTPPARSQAPIERERSGDEKSEQTTREPIPSRVHDSPRREEGGPVRGFGFGADVESSRGSAGKEASAPSREAGRIVRCFACVGSVIPTCSTCGGTRKIRVGPGFTERVDG